MGLNGAFLTGDLFNLFVFFEVLLAASYGLVLYGAGIVRVKAGLAYIAINLTASSLFLIGVSLIYGVTGTLNMADLAQRIPGRSRRRMDALLRGRRRDPCDRVPGQGRHVAPELLASHHLCGRQRAGRGGFRHHDQGRHLCDPASVDAAFRRGRGRVRGVWPANGCCMAASPRSRSEPSACWPRRASRGLPVSACWCRPAHCSRRSGPGKPCVDVGGAVLSRHLDALIAAFFLLIELVERLRDPGADVLAVTMELYGDIDEDDLAEEQEVGIAIPATIAILGGSFVGCALLLAGLPPLSGFIAKFAHAHRHAQCRTVRRSRTSTVTPSAWVLCGSSCCRGSRLLIAMTRTGISTFWARMETPSRASG